MRIRFCMACKTEPSVANGFCTDCNKKRCSKCGRVSVYNVRWDDKGKPYCPSCFKKVLLIASHIDGRTDLPSIEARLDMMENRLMRLESLIIGRRRESEPAQTNIESRIDNLIDTMDIPTESSPSVDEIKNRALEIMLESDKFTENDKD